MKILTKGVYEWTINSMIELFEITRAGYASVISPVIEQITRNKPMSFSQFEVCKAEIDVIKYLENK